ncbi:MAG: 2-C-methyl-D-erythritol 4-phosphate cytidylyltransferase [Pseudonocardiales bacterium]|nr:MAG: 2-C-methyl-D-erythritol 4-phosphate cytidylyltransferase [Pseudonocardiales bacterium]
MTAFRVAAVVVAGGSGTRFGADRNKVYLPLAGRTVVAWPLRAMSALRGLTRLMLVVRPQDRPLAADTIATDCKGIEVELVDGGDTRHGSELNAFRLLAPQIRAGEIDVVVVQDGARPVLSDAVLARVLEAAATHGGAVPCVPAGLLVELADGRVRRRLDDAHVRVQTPQAFVAAELLAAYEAADRDGFTGTDTASCVQRYTALQVRAVAGDPADVKVTRPGDLLVAEQILRARAG